MKGKREKYRRGGHRNGREETENDYEKERGLRIRKKKKMGGEESIKRT